MSEQAVRVIVIRHGIAEDAAARGIADSERGLTEEGVTRMGRGAAALAGLAPSLSIIGHSPLRRAVETAEIVATASGAGLQQLHALAPGVDPRAVFAWAASAPPGATIAIVGHEPDLGAWIARAIGARSAIPLKKGAAGAIRFDGEVAAAQGVLEWLLPPRVLRRLGSKNGY